MEAPANVSHDIGELASLDWSIAEDPDLAGAAGMANDAGGAAVGTVADFVADAAEIVAVATDRVATAVGRPDTRDDAPVLSPEHRAVLDFERQWWRLPGAKEQAIRDRFEISPTRYYQMLNAVLDVPAALSYDPTLVNRLRRLRSAGPRARRIGRASRTVG